MSSIEWYIFDVCRYKQRQASFLIFLTHKNSLHPFTKIPVLTYFYVKPPSFFKCTHDVIQVEQKSYTCCKKLYTSILLYAYAMCIFLSCNYFVHVGFRSFWNNKFILNLKKKSSEGGYVISWFGATPFYLEWPWCGTIPNASQTQAIFMAKVNIKKSLIIIMKVIWFRTA